MIKMDGIAAFVATAESGSISEAARQLGHAKSVISERLRRTNSSCTLAVSLASGVLLSPGT